MKPLYILGIESSCDDTSVALIHGSDKGLFVVSEKTASQIEIHQKFGGVVPEIAGRMHAEKIVPLIEEVLKDQPTPDAIAVTSGPGLITGLLVGVTAAKTFSLLKNLPLVSVNHIDGHIHSVELSNDTTKPQTPIAFPALCLVVSGGHTELILMRSHDDYTILGLTKDDAAGECFDKVAKLLELPYPGGPKISQLAKTGKTDAIDFPRPMLDHPNYDFSFSGLKTAALYWLQRNQLSAAHVSDSVLPTGISGVQSEPPTLNDFCASFEEAIVDTLVTKTRRAIEAFNPQSVILAGGVSANQKLRFTLEQTAAQYGLPFLRALPQYCMDNAAMIAAAGYYKATSGRFTPWHEMRVNPNWKVGPITRP